ncbi:hypothetical protein AAHZ94_23740 [Streptomyces sp. HSW2009]|uniref:hypothetical protein n=1 Tax=Streptomyces sp. HSW2009 TaxID=3142890 RepID=UPI0032EABDBC
MRSPHPALAYLHALRAPARQEKRKSAWFAAYVVVLLGASWGLPLLLAAGRAGHARDPQDGLGAHLLAGLPVTAPVLVVLVLTLTARAALWRGPVTIGMPELSWLLPTPLPRAPILLPRLYGSAVLAAVAGAAVGGVAGFLLSTVRGGPWLAAPAAGAGAGVVVAVIGTALGVAIERHERAALPYAARAAPVTWAVVVLLGGAAVAGTAYGVAAPLGALCLWSGPWGWAVPPLVAAVGEGSASAGASGRVPGGVPGVPGGVPGWMVALLLAATAVAGALWGARRQAPLVPLAALRRRATVATQVTAAIFSVALRQARTAVHGAGPQGVGSRGARPLLRLPLPRHRWLLIPWRDATALLRAPGRLAWATVWTGVAVGLAAYAPGLGQRARVFTMLAAAVAGYLAAAQLAEPARLETDDPRRATPLPTPAGTLALWHLVVPTALSLIGTATGAAVCAATGHWHPALALLTAATPAYAAAALVSAYRGALPTHVLLGTETPMGNTGGLQAALWYVRGPLALLALTTPALLVAASAEGHGRGAGQGSGQGSGRSLVAGGGFAVWAVLVGWVLGVGVAGAWWVRRRGRGVG